MPASSPTPARRPAPRPARRTALASCGAALLVAACGGNTVTDPPPGGGHQGGSNSVPAELVGKWAVTSVGNTNYYDSATGSWSSPSGDGDMWQFSPDGKFSHALLRQTSFYGCTTRIFYWDEGTVAASGGRVTLHSDRATITSEDNCNAQWNYERPATGTTGGVDFAVEDRDGRQVLTFQWSDGAQSYRRS